MQKYVNFGVFKTFKNFVIVSPRLFVRPSARKNSKTIAVNFMKFDVRRFY
jgi:hypothetical protein